MRLDGKPVALGQLAGELTAAGIPFRGLGTFGEGANVELHTYDPAGAIVDLPAGAASVVAAHTPAAPPASPEYGADLPNNYAYQIADGVTQLRAYLALATPTAAQSTAALKLVIRGLLWLVAREWRQGV